MKLPAKAFSPALALLALLPALPTHSAFENSGGEGGVVLEAMEKLAFDLTGPPVAFAIRNRGPEADLFSSVDGGDELNNVRMWQIQIFDQGGRKVSFIQGRNRPPSASIPWAGTSSSGAPLPDGFYKAKLVWIDSDKRIHATRRTSVSLSTPLEIRNLAGMKLRFNYTEEGLVVSIAEGMIFEPGQSRIQDAALPALREIFRFLQSYPGNRITIRGYTDSSGSLERNLLLSRERAACVCRYFIHAGISPGRLTYKGLGPAEPVADNMTETGRSKNRRVEVIILKTTG